jgi:hypothetical protein
MGMDIIKTAPAIFSEQTPPKSRASAKAECLQNDSLNNNTEVLISNTIKYIDSNTISTQDEKLYNEAEDNEICNPEFSDGEDPLANVTYNDLLHASAAAQENKTVRHGKKGLEMEHNLYLI